MDRGFAAVADDIADIKSKMATRDDIANLCGQLTSVERDLNRFAGISTISEKGSRTSPASRKKSITPLSALRDRKAPRPRHEGRRLTDTINYVATDQSGLTSTSTRTVIVSESQAANDNQASATPANDIPPLAAGATTATSSSQ
jgi:hypothetical protein